MTFRGCLRLARSLGPLLMAAPGQPCLPASADAGRAAAPGAAAA